MASRLFFSPSLLHPKAIFCLAGAGASAAFLYHNLNNAQKSSWTYRLDSSPAPVASSSAKDWSFNQYQSEAKAPIVRRDGSLNRSAVRQLSAGSITGLAAGLAVSLFSKPLALLLGLLVVGLQSAESYLGIHLVPWQRLQRVFTSVDVRSAVQDNVAFKISFGMMFALSAFAEL